MEELNRLRVRLTAWYVGVFAVVLLAFGVALFAVLTRQISARLDASLAAATEEVARATLHELQEPPGPGPADPMEELRIPGRTLYLFDESGGVIHPDRAPAWVRDLAVSALERGDRQTERDVSAVTWRAHAHRFALPDGSRRVGIAAADMVELDHQYAGLLLAFGLAAGLALALLGGGGWLVAHRSTEPVRDAFQRMRDFMADAAHELRTPVAVVEGHAEVALRQPREKAEYVEILRSVHGEAARLAGILENLLTVARADAGAWPVRLESVFLDDILLDVVENARVLGADKRVTLDVTALEELPVQGDPDLLRQLLMILLDNAIKFSRPESVVRVAVRRDDGQGVLEVADDGPGIEASRLPHVFERFHRGDRARQRESGAGLGLSIARWTADVHGAGIGIDSEPGHGTRVTVQFPLEQLP